TDVERGEEAMLAAADQRAKETVTQEPAPAEESAPTDPVEVAEGPPDMFQATEGRWGSREVEITQVQLLDEKGQPAHIFHSGDQVTLRLTVKAAAPIDDFAFGIGLFNADGICCYGTNTTVEELTGESLSGEGQVDLILESLDLVEGTYKLDVAVHKRDGYPYD